VKLALIMLIAEPCIKFCASHN